MSALIRQSLHKSAGSPGIRIFGIGVILLSLAVSNSFGQASLSVVGHVNSGGVAKCVAVSSHYAYLANYDDYLRVYDISAPEHPIMVGEVKNPGPTYAMAVSNGFAYLANLTNGLQIYNISDPHKPVHAASITEGEGELSVMDIVIAGKCAYIAKNGLYIYDVSNPSSPKRLGQNHIDNYVLGVATSGRYAGVTSLIAGLRFFDISDPAKPSLVSRTEKALAPTTDAGKDGAIRIAGRYAYTINTVDGFRIYDISDPTHPGKISPKLKLPAGLGAALFISDDYVYEANVSFGLRIYDVSTPTNARMVAYAKPPGTACGIAVSSHYIYLANGADGLRIYSVGKHVRK
jgi:hypothetical protein